ncbi:MAG: hypothetical protein JNL98_27595 [Bryobacterales bacterium]|nr:hypothetical protein [Bryobacterales bacterium]
MIRREFLELTALANMPALASDSSLLSLGPCKLSGGLREGSTGAAPLEGGIWYEADAPGAALSWEFPAGTLKNARMLTADFLLDGVTALVFTLDLVESATAGEPGRRFRLTFAGLNQCSFRMRMDLGLTGQNRWQADREGAFLKPIVSGDRVDPAKVSRAVLTLYRMAGPGARFCATALRASTIDVPKLANAVLPKGPLVDEMGQSRLQDWTGKTKSVDDLVARLRAQHKDSTTYSVADRLTRWGGSKQHKLRDGSGYFGVAKSDGRWWLVDPDGHAFWSAGADCVRVDFDARVDGIEKALTWIPPESGYREARKAGLGGRPGARFVNYFAANLIRAFGERDWRERWAALALGEMRRMGFNTVGNWSEWQAASKARFPYVRPLEGGPPLVARVYRDFPDVYDPGFAKEAARTAESLRASANDPALIGYFLMNEPTWGFSSELPAAGMLYTAGPCATRRELASHLQRKYPDAGALSAAWKLSVTLERVEKGKWVEPLTPEAKNDLREFSSRMAGQYFRILSEACRKVDPNHLNLGMRWAGVPPDWAVEGMKSFDVFSLNCYMEKLPRDRSERIHELLGMPVMVGEWHFGALDAGLPASGIGHVRTQADRGRAYRVYLEDAAANPLCVGVHWFTLYDQSSLGRFDGENYNIGFLDICHQAYAPLAEAAVASHGRMYEVAAGRQQAYADAPEYLPKLFL